MTSFIGVSSPRFPSPTILQRPFSPPRSISPLTQFKNNWCWKINCKPTQEAESEAETPPPTTTTPMPSSTSNSSTYNGCTVLGGVGFLETSYLTFLKVSNTDAFCPVGGGSCGDVLNSDYAVVFGVPLPVFGMVAYGLVGALGFLLPRKNLPFGIDEANGRLALVGITTSMAAASGYFLYILSTELSGATCIYCLMSAILSFSLFFITLKDFEAKEIQKLLVLQLCTAGLVIASLSASYSTLKTVSSSNKGEVELEYYSTDITTPSSPYAISLAKHLSSIGAKMYGAFWCSHCLEQKQMFGNEASKLLNYVECFPDGYRKGTRIFKACSDAKLEGFPTWVINGQTLSGELELSELARISGFEHKE